MYMIKGFSVSSMHLVKIDSSLKGEDFMMSYAKVISNSQKNIVFFLGDTNARLGSYSQDKNVHGQYVSNTSTEKYTIQL